MAVLTSEELKKIIENDKQRSVSIYMPTHRKGPQIEQDPIRLKNLLKKAEQLLSDSGMRKNEIESLLEPATKLLEDSIFWQHQSDGLAIFISDGEFRTYRLPYHFDELTVVTDRYHIKPLLPVLVDDSQFYVLAISQKQVRLMQGSGFSISEIELEGLPSSLADIFDPDRDRTQLQWYTGAPGHGAGKRDAVFHGTGAGEEDRKKEVQKFFSQVDRGINEFLTDTQFPLVLAAVDYLIPMYREVSKYPNLLDDAITGNPDEASPKELHEQAWKIVQPVVTQARDKTWERYQQLKNTNDNLTDSDVKEVVKSAATGRVDSLFVTTGEQRWGRFDLNNNKVVMHDEEETGDYDLIDVAAAYTLTRGGSVFTMPGNGAKEPVAAIYRY